MQKSVAGAKKRGRGKNDEGKKRERGKKRVGQKRGGGRNPVMDAKESGGCKKACLFKKKRG